MPNSKPPEVVKDDNGRTTEFTSEGGVSGPLGIWPWPILNLLLSNQDSKVEVTRINRDEKGRIESIEEIKL